MTAHPRHRSDWKDTLLADLMAHAGCWRNLGILHAPECPSYERCCAVRDAVVYWRRHGYSIEGSRAGYRLTGGQLMLTDVVTYE